MFRLNTLSVNIYKSLNHLYFVYILYYFIYYIHGWIFIEEHIYPSIWKDGYKIEIYKLHILCIFF